LVAVDLAEGVLHPDRMPYRVNVNVRFHNHGWAHEPAGLRPQNQNVAAAPPAAAAGPLPRAHDANVHGLGRDAATRRALAHLLLADPDIDVAGSLQILRDHMQTAEQERLPLSQARHRSGVSVLTAARRALGAGPQRETNVAAITHRGNRLVIDARGVDRVPMARICAVIWRAIDRIESPQGTPEATAALQQERRDAFVLALSRCVEDLGHIVCAPGQSQRLVLVLQGYGLGVQVEIYDAPAPVAQFVTMQALQMQQQLGVDGPWPEGAVRRALNEACLAGYAIYQGQDRQNLQQQLVAIAELTYDLNDWQPPVG
jgi:hypothetical protein